MEFLTKYRIEVMEHPHSPDLTLCILLPEIRASRINDTNEAAVAGGEFSLHLILSLQASLPKCT